MTIRPYELGWAALLSIACGGTEPSAPPVRAPIIAAVSVAVNPDNVLSLLVHARVEEADSVAVRFARRDDGTAAQTPTTRPVDDPVPVFGLWPETTYQLQLIAWGPGGTVTSDSFEATTGVLPPDLPRYTASGRDPSPGFVVFAAGRYGLAIDNTGRVVWYHAFPNGPGLNFMPLPPGGYAARPQGSPWVVVDVLGGVTRSFGCARGLQARFHDAIMEQDGSVWLLCDEVRTADLSAVGGPAEARVSGTAVQKLDATGELAFEWSPFDHLGFTPFDRADLSGNSLNWTHGNALALDRDGNVLISFRNLNEIAKIDTRTGAVLWRMGGRATQFHFTDAAGVGFARQHGLRVARNGDLLLLDNLGDPAGSRVERHASDPERGVASLVRAYAPATQVAALLGGTTQELPNGHVLVAYGNGGRVEEYDAAGAVVWQIDGNPGYVFRAQRIKSLYAPGGR